MADTLPPDLQARISADPTIQAALRQFEAAQKDYAQRRQNGRVTARVAADDPAYHTAMLAFGNAIKNSPVVAQLPKDYQVNYDGQLQHISDFTPNKLALIIGGSLATAGLLSGAGVGTSAATSSSAAATPAATTAASVLPSTTIGSGFIPAIAGGSGMASIAPAATGATAALSTGSKLASIASGINKVGSALSPNNVGGPDSSSPRGAAYAAQAGQLAANRAASARIDQSGPAADAQAFRNQMRASLVARMDPNASPIILNGQALPRLATPEGVGSAAKLRDTLAARVNAGKTPTTFGVGDPTQEELDAQAKAADAAGVGDGINSKIANVGDYLQTGSRLANLGLNGWNLGKNIVSMF